MAKLPTASELSGPVIRNTGMPQVADQTGFARGLTNVGADVADIGNSLRTEQNVTQTIEADGGFSPAINDLERSFDEDGDYGTQAQRFLKGAQAIRDQYAAKITDMKARGIFAADADKKIETYRNRIASTSEGRQREQRLVGAKTGLEGYQKIIADPSISEDDREKAKRASEASIGALQSTGLLTPDQANEWRKNVLEGGEFVYGQREIERDPSVISGKLPSSLSGRSDAAMQFFMSKGWTKEQSAGIVGNLLAESKLDGNSLNPGDGRDGSDSIGIGQWNGDRARALKAFAADKGADWRDVNTQLEFVNHELSTTEKAAGDRIRSASDITGAAEGMIMYERPAGSQNGPQGAHNYKGRVSYAMQAAGQDVKPDWFKNLPPEKQLQLERQADARGREIQTQQAAQQKAAQIQAKDDFSLRIANRDTKLSREEILGNTVLDNGDKATLIRQYDEAEKEGLAIGQAMPLFTSGVLGSVVDPYSEQGKKLVNGMANTLAKTIQPEQQQAVMEDLARQSGYVPQPYFNGIRSGLASGDVQSVAGAAQAAVRINQINPNILGRSTDGNKVQDAATSFQYYTQNMGLTPEQAAQKLIDASDPAKMREREALLKSKPIADELKNLSASDVTKAMGSSWGTDVGAPQTEELRRVGVNPDAEAAIVGDFRRYVEEAVTETGDLDLAKSVAGERFKRIYGTSQFSPVGGDVIMRYPVEKAYPADPSGSHDWVKAQAIEALKGEGVDAGNVYLMPMPNGQTERDIQTGRPARYQIFYEDKNGALQQFNLPFYGDAKAAMEGFNKAKADVRSEYESGMIENRGAAILDAVATDAIRTARSEAEQKYRDYPEQYRSQMVREAERRAMNDAAR